MLKRTLALLLVVGGILPMTVSAQVSQLASDSSDFISYSDLAERVKTLEARIASYGSGSAGCDSCGAGRCDQACCGFACSNSCCNDCGFFGRVDLVFAKPYFTDGIAPGDSDYDFSFTPRFILGYEGGGGGGIRARYWWFDDVSSVADGTANMNLGAQTQLKVDVYDLEFTRELRWRYVQGTLFGGVRYADIDHRQIANSPARTQADGWGPTLGIDTLTSVSGRCSLVGNFRYSTLFGDAIGNGFTSSVFNDFAFGSLEAQLGVRWQHRCDYGTLRLSGLVEAQQWMGVGEQPDNVGQRPDEDIYFLGLVFGIEFLR